MYNYEKNQEKKIVKLRLVHDYKNKYVLKFRTEGWCSLWHTVEEYTPTTCRSDRPGDGTIYGNWNVRWWTINSDIYGKRLLEELRSELKTVGDIYRRYIKPGIDRMNSDYARYREYQNELNSVSSVFK